jgi:polyhydroxybutyrate depolymerase
MKILKSILKILLYFVGILTFIVAILAAYLFTQINRSDGQIMTSEGPRKYLLHIPERYDAEKPTPLVISIHGFAEWPAHQMQLSRWNDLADQENFIVVYPRGTRFPLRWRTEGMGESMLDVQFISDLIDQLQKEYNIDPTRIYTNGLSNGGGMSFLLACKLSDRIAAFGSVAGAYRVAWENCNPSRPVPAIIFHGNADPIVPFEGGPSGSFDVPFPIITEWVQQMSLKNDCESIPEAIPTQGEVSGLRYTNCSQNAEVDFYVIDGGGHSWPGGDPLPEWIVGYTSDDIDTTRVMWEFFSAHTMPGDH